MVEAIGAKRRRLCGGLFKLDGTYTSESLVVMHAEDFDD